MKTREGQLPLPGFNWKNSKAFGGAGKAKGNPRTARPVAVKRPMHLVLKSHWLKELQAKASSGPQKNSQTGFFFCGRDIERLCVQTGGQTLVKVKDIALGNDHIHLIIQPKSTKAYRAFIRALSGLIARRVMRAEKGRPAVGRARGLANFWEARPFTRILEGAREYLDLKNYLQKNRLDYRRFLLRSDSQLKTFLAAIRQMDTLQPLGFA